MTFTADLSLLIHQLDSIEISSRTLKVIHALFSALQYSILIDGKKTEFFSANPGLGEGTAISQLLFLVFFEFLYIELDRASEFPGIEIFGLKLLYLFLPMMFFFLPARSRKPDYSSTL